MIQYIMFCTKEVQYVCNCGNSTVAAAEDDEQKQEQEQVQVQEQEGS